MKIKDPWEPEEDERIRKLLGDDIANRLIFISRRMQLNTQIYETLTAAKIYLESMQLVRNNVYDEICEVLNIIDKENDRLRTQSKMD